MLNALYKRDQFSLTVGMADASKHSATTVSSGSRFFALLPEVTMSEPESPCAFSEETEEFFSPSQYSLRQDSLSSREILAASNPLEPPKPQATTGRPSRSNSTSAGRQAVSNQQGLHAFLGNVSFTSSHQYPVVEAEVVDEPLAISTSSLYFTAQETVGRSRSCEEGNRVAAQDVPTERDSYVRRSVQMPIPGTSAISQGQRQEPSVTSDPITSEAGLADRTSGSGIPRRFPGYSVQAISGGASTSTSAYSEARSGAHQVDHDLLQDVFSSKPSAQQVSAERLVTTESLPIHGISKKFEDQPAGFTQDVGAWMDDRRFGARNSRQTAAGADDGELAEWSENDDDVCSLCSSASLGEEGGHGKVTLSSSSASSLDAAYFRDRPRGEPMGSENELTISGMAIGNPQVLASLPLQGDTDRADTMRRTYWLRGSIEGADNVEEQQLAVPLNVAESDEVMDTEGNVRPPLVGQSEETNGTNASTSVLLPEEWDETKPSSAGLAQHASGGVLEDEDHATAPFNRESSNRFSGHVSDVLSERIVEDAGFDSRSSQVFGTGGTQILSASVDHKKEEEEGKSTSRNNFDAIPELMASLIISTYNRKARFGGGGSDDSTICKKSSSRKMAPTPPGRDQYLGQHKLDYHLVVVDEETKQGSSLESTDTEQPQAPPTSTSVPPSAPLAATSTDQRASSPSVMSVSSVASSKRLEWDSGADIGYGGPRVLYGLSTLERMAIGNYCFAFKRTEPEGKSALNSSTNLPVLGLPPSVPPSGGSGDSTQLMLPIATGGGAISVTVEDLQSTSPEDQEESHQEHDHFASQQADGLGDDELPAAQSIRPPHSPENGEDYHPNDNHHSKMPLSGRRPKSGDPALHHHRTPLAKIGSRRSASLGDLSGVRRGHRREAYAQHRHRNPLRTDLEQQEQQRPTLPASIIKRLHSHSFTDIVDGGRGSSGSCRKPSNPWSSVSSTVSSSGSSTVIGFPPTSSAKKSSPPNPFCSTVIDSGGQLQKLAFSASPTSGTAGPLKEGGAGEGKGTLPSDMTFVVQGRMGTSQVDHLSAPKVAWGASSSESSSERVVEDEQVVPVPSQAKEREDGSPSREAIIQLAESFVERMCLSSDKERKRRLLTKILEDFGIAVDTATALAEEKNEESVCSRPPTPKLKLAARETHFVFQGKDFGVRADATSVVSHDGKQADFATRHVKSSTSKMTVPYFPLMEQDSGYEKVSRAVERTYAAAGNSPSKSKAAKSPTSSVAKMSESSSLPKSTSPQSPNVQTVQSVYPTASMYKTVPPRTKGTVFSSESESRSGSSRPRIDSWCWADGRLQSAINVQPEFRRQRTKVPYLPTSETIASSFVYYNLGEHRRPMDSSSSDKESGMSSRGSEVSGVSTTRMLLLPGSRRRNAAAVGSGEDNGRVRDTSTAVSSSSTDIGDGLLIHAPSSDERQPTGLKLIGEFIRSQRRSYIRRLKKEVAWLERIEAVLAKSDRGRRMDGRGDVVYGGSGGQHLEKGGSAAGTRAPAGMSDPISSETATKPSPTKSLQSATSSPLRKMAFVRTRDFGQCFPTPLPSDSESPREEHQCQARQSVGIQTVAVDVERTNQNDRALERPVMSIPVHDGHKQPIRWRTELYPSSRRRGKPTRSQEVASGIATARRKSPVAWFLPLDNSAMPGIRVGGRRRRDRRRSGSQDDFIAFMGSSTAFKSNQQPLQLQEALKLMKPDLLRHLLERHRRIQAVAEKRHVGTSGTEYGVNLISISSRLRKFTVPMSLSSQHHRPRRRPMSHQQMRKQTEKVYHVLPEVTEKEELKTREDVYRTNRLMAQIFKKRLQEKVLKGQVNLLNTQKCL